MKLHLWTVPWTVKPVCGLPHIGTWPLPCQPQRVPPAPVLIPGSRRSRRTGHGRSVTLSEADCPNLPAALALDLRGVLSGRPKTLGQDVPREPALFFAGEDAVFEKAARRLSSRPGARMAAACRRNRQYPTDARDPTAFNIGPQTRTAQGEIVLSARQQVRKVG
jgi:hypothetical protein